MNIDKMDICDWLAGKADPEVVSAIEADLRDRDSSVTLAWLARLADASRKYDQAVESGRLERWLDEDDDDLLPEAGEAPEEGHAIWGEQMGMLAGTRGASPWAVTGGTAPWPLSFPDDGTGRSLARTIGERCYGNPEQGVTLTLHVTQAEDGGGKVLAELEASPPPSREPLLITVEFSTADRRTFTAAVPVSPRPSTRSGPCEPLPAGAARARGGVWLDGIWPPVFKLS